MALTTVAATIQPDDTLSKLPPSVPKRFLRSDWIAAAIVFRRHARRLHRHARAQRHAGGLGRTDHRRREIWRGPSARLSVLDHVGFRARAPPAVWRKLAWRINLLCALFGAVSNGVLTLLVCHSGRWLAATLDHARAPVATVRPYVFYIGLLVGPGHRLQRRDVEPGRDLRRARHAQRALRESHAALLLPVDARAAQDLAPRPRRLCLFARADQSSHARSGHPRVPARRRARCTSCRSFSASRSLRRSASFSPS